MSTSVTGSETVFDQGFALAWPLDLRPTATRERWFQALAVVQPGLPLDGVARALQCPYGTARRWAELFGYASPDARRNVAPQEWDRADWGESDSQIARRLGVSRERVRQVRVSRAAGPSRRRSEVARFREFVVASEHRLHGETVGEAICLSGCAVSYDVARRILRRSGVRAPESQSPWPAADWRLPNARLALLWGKTTRYVAKTRARLRVGPAQWDARDSRHLQDSDFLNAISRERRRAAAWPPAQMNHKESPALHSEAIERLSIHSEEVAAYASC